MKKIVIMSFFFVVLILFGCDMNIDDSKKDNEKKLWQGIQSGNLEAVKEAIENGADINEFSQVKYHERTNHNRKTSSPLLIALFSGRFEIAEYLIDCGADVNYIDDQGESLLQYCAEFYPKIIEKVIIAGADISYKDKHGDTALEYAATYNVNNASQMAFDVLIKYGAEPTLETYNKLMENLTVEKYGMMHTTVKALSNENIDEAIRTVFSGDKVPENIIINDEYEIDGIAAFGNQEDLKRYLSGADIYQLLKVAIMYNNKEVVSMLLSSHNYSVPVERENLLYYAASHDDVELVQMIYDSIGGDVSLAASQAISKNNLKVLQYFLDKGIEPESECLEGTLLGSCSFYGNYEAAIMLLKFGATVDDDALTKACVRGDVKLVQLYIENGANADCKNYYADGSGGRSALLQTIDAGQFECIKILIENGADIYYEYEKNNAIDEAKNSGSKKIYEYILSCVNQ